MKRGLGVAAAVIITGFAVLLICHTCKSVSVDPGQYESITPVDTVAVELSDLTSEAIRAADSVMSGMSLPERVGQCFMPSVFASNDSLNMSKLARYRDELKVGGVLLLKGKLESALQMTTAASESNVPLWIAIDAEWGLGMRLEDAPGFPRNGHIGNNCTEESLYSYGREVGRQCRRVGINMVLGPVVDVAENPNGIIGSRSFGGDPVLVANYGVAYSKGVESVGVVSVAKHFPGHGNSSQDSHLSVGVLDRDLQELDSIDLFPFRKYIESGLTGVMVGHLAVGAVDGSGHPAAASRAIMVDLLRGKMGFRGIVMTDALNMGGFTGYSAADALVAGADIVIGMADTEREMSNVIKMTEAGEIADSVVADRCRRILFYKFLLGLDKRPLQHSEGLRSDVALGADTVRAFLRNGN